MIRSVTPGDLWSLRRKPRRQVVLYNKPLLVQPHKPFRVALRCFFEGSRRDYAMLVLRERGICALVQARARYKRPELDILYLATQRTGKQTLPTDSDLWFRLLEELTVSAGQQHIQRLYAALGAHQPELLEIFRQLNFQPYARRVVLQLSGPDWDQGTTIALMRPQSRHDIWGIHKLYGLIAPHFVQYAEARTSRSWALSLGQRWVSLRQRGWVLGQADDLHAHLGMISGTQGHVLSLLLHPDARDNLTNVLRFGLSQIYDDKPVYLLLTEYQSELWQPAESLGFQPIGEQTLLMKTTAVPVYRPALRPVLEPGLEPQITVPNITREEHHGYTRADQDSA